MHVNKNKVLFSGTHCQLRRCKCLFTYTGLFHGTLSSGMHVDKVSTTTGNDGRYFFSIIY